MAYRYRILIAAGVAAVLAVLYFIVDPVGNWWMPKCPFKILTGLQCPGCGTQRMAHALLHGHIAEAISYNYFMALAGPYILAFVVEWLMPNGKARKKLRRVIENSRLVWAYVITFCLWLVVRNILHV